MAVFVLRVLPAVSLRGRMPRKKTSTLPSSRADIEAERQRIEAQASTMRSRARKQPSKPKPLNALEQVAARGAHLGTPNSRQIAKPGASYELAPPEYDGDVRARRKFLLTPPAMRTDSVRAALIKAHETGKTVDELLVNRDTPLDKVLGPALTPAIHWYINIHERVLNGHKPIVNYSGANSRGDPGNKLALQPADERERGAYAFVNQKLKLHEQEFLHVCTICQFPDAIDLTVHNVVVEGVALRDMTRAEVGRLLLGIADARRAEGGFDGYCKAVTTSLNDIMIEYSITELRRTGRKMRDEQDAKRMRVLGMEPTPSALRAARCSVSYPQGNLVSKKN